ncbi:hypothetical protein QTP86_007400 [Hemibagrus guttatus]|nr:hypothetical protein QTP86_007400 [Hemibagrus guttatus]
MLQTISPDLLLFITTVINGSLTSGHVPTVFKKARVIPILKKPALDPSDISNYRPVSLLSFLSKILERVVCNQLSDYLMQNNLHDPNQSGFKAAHSTETALLAVTEKLHAARSTKLSSVLILLDLSAAFDTVNHKTLLSTLRSLGICGTAWEWFASYLDGRSYQRQQTPPHFSFAGGGYRQYLAPALWGVPGTSETKIFARCGRSSVDVARRECSAVDVARRRDSTVDVTWGPPALPSGPLIPSQRQLVFQGDRLPLQCTASYLDPSVSLRWSHNHCPVHTHDERGVYVEDSIIHDCCLITSELILSNVDADVSGNWQCHVTSSRGNSSIGMEIVVLETSALYCSAERVTGNKGDFRWPKTQAGLMAFLPCATASYRSHEKRAWRRCDKQGRWAEDDYNQCPYSSKFTRMLHELTQLGDYVSDIASNMMQVEEHILWMAQNEARACTRIVQCVERIADLTFNTHSQNISKVSANIALEAFVIKPSSLMGLLCTVMANPALGPVVVVIAVVADELIVDMRFVADVVGLKIWHHKLLVLED